MVACSYCTSVGASAWWSGPLVARLVAVMVVVGLPALVVAWRSVGPRRLGAALVAAGVLVAMPVALVVAGTTDTGVEVATSQPPADSPFWHVRCFTAFPTSASEDTLGAEMVEACREATATRRWTATAIGVLGVGMALAGAVIATRGHSSRRPTPAAAHA